VFASSLPNEKFIGKKIFQSEFAGGKLEPILQLWVHKFYGFMGK
jgi:hypothetical protein